MIKTRYWKNAYSVMRTANGLGFDKVYLVDLAMGKPPRMNTRKIDLQKPPHDMFVLLNMEEFMEKIVPNYNVVSMELTDEAEYLSEFEWPDNPLIVLGPENGNIPPEILETGAQVKVPMKGAANCFNVACAASIAIWDYLFKERYEMLRLRHRANKCWG